MRFVGVPRWCRLIVLAAVTTIAQLLLTQPLRAHERGRPVPVVSKQVAGAYTVSVWSTSDAGTGTMYVVAHEAAGGGGMVPQSVRVTLRSHPRGDSTTYFLAPQAVSRGARFTTPVYLDRAGMWDVDVQLLGTAGDAHLRTVMQVSAPGAANVATLLLYAAPFVLVAGLWGRARWLRRTARPSVSLAVSPL